MNRSIRILLLSIATACGGGSAMSGSTTPIADPIPMIETPPAPGPGGDPVVADEPVMPPEPGVAAAPVAAEPVIAEPGVAAAPVRAAPVGAAAVGAAPVAPAPAPVEAGAPAKPRPARVRPAAPTRVQIVVTGAGFEPKNVDVPRGKPVILRFERQIERTCGTEVVMVVDGKKIVKDLPFNTPVDLAVTFHTAGTVKYSCAMDMIRGTITVK